jgi:hypothetical protein
MLTARDTAKASMHASNGLNGECFYIKLPSTFPLKKLAFSFINSEDTNTCRHAIIVQNK